MSKPHADPEEHVVFDRVDDAVITDTDTKTGPALQRPCTRRSRILGEQGDGALDAATSLRVELA